MFRRQWLPLLVIVALVVAIAAVGGVSKRSSASSDELRVLLPQSSETTTTSGATDRIVNGTKAPAITADSRWRSITKLLIVNKAGSVGLCGGTLVAKRYIVTAAHCVSNNTTGVMDTELIVGVNGTANTDAFEKAFDSARTLTDVKAIPSKVSGSFLSVTVTKHPQYDPDKNYNDIAVVKIDRDAKFNPTLIPGSTEPGSWGGGNGVAGARIAGWGTLTSGGADAPVDLREATIPVVSDAACRANYAQNGDTLNGGHLCGGTRNSAAAGQNNGVDTCQGDSGGPLLGTAVDGSVRLIGVTSFGIGCAHRTYYGVYANVSYYRAWIEGITGKVSGTTNTPVTVTGGGGTTTKLAITAPASGATIPETGRTRVAWTGGDTKVPVEVIQRVDGVEENSWVAATGATSLEIDNTKLDRWEDASELCVLQNDDTTTRVCVPIKHPYVAPQRPVVQMSISEPAGAISVGARGATRFAWSGNPADETVYVELEQPIGSVYDTEFVPAGSSSYLLGHGLLREGVSNVCVSVYSSGDTKWCRTVTKSSAVVAPRPNASGRISSGLLRNGRLTLTGQLTSNVRSVRVRVQARVAGRWVTVGTKRVAVPLNRGYQRFSVSRAWKSRLGSTLTVRTTVFYGSSSKTVVTYLR